MDHVQVRLADVAACVERRGANDCIMAGRALGSQPVDALWSSVLCLRRLSRAPWANMFLSAR
jgi:hypothetical protein